MADETNAEQAERLSKRRALIMPFLAIVYLGQQYSYLSSAGGTSPVGGVRIGAWAVMSAVLMVALMSGGGLLRSREVRAMINDETSRAHRSDALAWGFVVAMVTGIVLYILGPNLIDQRETIHVIVSLGIATGMIRFGMLERRAMRDA